ncbi:MAG TPA: protease inhibitor I42 family protein [Candidatus Dormibacteraeota bacterium]|nr:protease inhibitor I42 family protein [Candidatus Dormibacteraeota bacterium]
MTRIGVGIGMVCLAAVGYVSARAQAKQEAPAKQAAPDQSTAVNKDKNRKQGAAEEVKPTKKVTVNVVFAGDTKFIDAVKASCQDLHPDKLQDCFAGEMKKAGATPAAVEFSKQLGEPGFVRDFRAAGPVDIAYVLYPYRANENQSWLIVNGDPPAIDVDNSKLVTVAARALKNNATYAGLAKAHPDLSPWPGDRYSTETPDVEMGAKGGVHIIVNYRLRERCHSCAVLGHAWYSFEFDAKGLFAGARLMAISVGNDKAPVIRPTSKTITIRMGGELTSALPVKDAAASEWTLAKALDTAKVRLIEHSHVAPPAGNGAAGTEELWKFAALGAGTTEVAFQRAGEKPIGFRVVVKGTAAGLGRSSPKKQ